MASGDGSGSELAWLRGKVARIERAEAEAAGWKRSWELAVENGAKAGHEVDRLREELRIARFDADVPIRELREQVDRLREALQRILDHGQTHDEPCWALHRGDCADVFQEIARAALDA